MTDPLRAVIADDEPLGRQRIRKALSRHGDVELVGEAADGQETIDLIRALEPDLLFLDIRMPGCDGFDVLASVAQTMPPFVIFVTAYDDRAVDAFRVHAADYLVKPFDDARFDDALRHVRARRAAGAAAPSTDAQRLLASLGPQTAPARYLRRIAVTSNARTRFISTGDVRYIEARGNYVLLHAGTQTHLVRTGLAELLDQLDPASFARIHRSTVLNLEYLRDIQPWFTGDYVATLSTGEQLRVSRRFRDQLLRSLC